MNHSECDQTSCITTDDEPPGSAVALVQLNSYYSTNTETNLLSGPELSASPSDRTNGRASVEAPIKSPRGLRNGAEKGIFPKNGSTRGGQSAKPRSLETAPLADGPRSSAAFQNGAAKNGTPKNGIPKGNGLPKSVTPKSGTPKNETVKKGTNESRPVPNDVLLTGTGKNSHDKVGSSAVSEVVHTTNRLLPFDFLSLAKPRSASSNPLTRAFRRRFFPETTDKEWNDWRWQSRHRVRTLAQIEQMLDLSQAERDALTQGGTMLPVGITPYYMSLLDRHDSNQPLRRTVVPVTNEFTRTIGEADDPLGEDGHSPVPGLVHRYPDRVLLLALDFCSTYCRYCTRSRVVGHGEITPNEARLEAAFDYLRRTPSVRDVLISGGDPLALSDDRLDWMLTKLRAIPHIEFVRIGTKMPAVLPQRITSDLVRMLRKHHPLWMSVHFLHPDECTPESAKACGRLADAGIPLGSQTVLLKGVNDDVETMKQMVHKLLLMRVRPYYLYQCDPISGSSHFRTPVSTGLEIIQGLRGHTTGYAVPTYVIDAPGGGGKIPLQPDSVVGRDGDFLILKNFEGQTFRYPDPLPKSKSSAAIESDCAASQLPTGAPP